ncbi:MAG: amidohydrolase family protein [Clostridia bacterium]|nr:amidohydrolase family protein [Clostridia bacterium]
MKCYTGAILTVDRDNRVVRYLVEDGGKIVYTGDTLPEEYQSAERIDLGDRALVPSFADTHEHLASYAIFHAGLNVMEAVSNKEIMQLLGDFAAREKGRTLIAFGASPYSVAEGRLISREELDSVVPDREVMVVKYDGHACIVNSKLLARLKRKVEGLRGYHPDTGEMNQEAFFKVSDDITGSISVLGLIGHMQQAVDDLAKKGIGCVHTVSGVGFPMNLDITMEMLFAKSLKNGFQVRVFPQSLDVNTALRRGLPRIGGCFQCALDGCFGSHDAAMNQPYADDGKDLGVLYYDDEKVTAFCKKANRAGLQIELHAIGDRAFDQACRCLKAALDDFPREDHRHGIIHDCLPTAEGLAICQQYHIQMPVQSAFIGWKQEPDEYLAQILGPERAEALNPLRDFWDKGVMISAGSDAPCTEPDPIAWMDKAVNHTNPAQRLTVQEALRMCTVNGYAAAFDDDTRGTLEMGKVADMVILSGNPYETPADKLHTLQVEQLLLAGKPYASCKRPVVPSLVAAMFSSAKA